MKTIAVLLSMLSLATMGYSGQTNQVDLRQIAPTAPPQRPATAALVAPHRTNAVSLFHIEKSYSGVLPDLRKERSEFLRSPPPPRNREFRNVSINPVTGRAEGLILFSINF
jgi:hypothetical protein